MSEPGFRGWVIERQVDDVWVECGTASGEQAQAMATPIALKWAEQGFRVRVLAGPSYCQWLMATFEPLTPGAVVEA